MAQLLCMLAVPWEGSVVRKVLCVGLTITATPVDGRSTAGCPAMSLTQDMVVHQVVCLDNVC
jgi:hypothetical protein